MRDCQVSDPAAYAEKILYTSFYFTTMKSANIEKGHVVLVGANGLPFLAIGTDSLKAVCSQGLLLFESNRMRFVPSQSVF